MENRSLKPFFLSSCAGDVRRGGGGVAGQLGQRRRQTAVEGTRVGHERRGAGRQGAPFRRPRRVLRPGLPPQDARRSQVTHRVVPLWPVAGFGSVSMKLTYHAGFHKEIGLIRCVAKAQHGDRKMN